MRWKLQFCTQKTQIILLGVMLFEKITVLKIILFLPKI